MVSYLLQHNINGTMSNYINLFMYSYWLIPNYTILRQLIKVPYEDKKNSKYLLKGIRMFCPETLEIPLYSRHTLRTINWDTMELMYTQNKIEKVRKALKKYYVYLHRSFIRKAYFVLKGDQKGLAEFNKEKHVFKEFFDKISVPLVTRSFYIDKLRKYSDGTFLRELYILLLLLDEDVKPL